MKRWKEEGQRTKEVSVCCVLCQRRSSGGAQSKSALQLQHVTTPVATTLHQGVQTVSGLRNKGKAPPPYKTCTREEIPPTSRRTNCGGQRRNNRSTALRRNTMLHDWLCNEGAPLSVPRAVRTYSHGIGDLEFCV